MALLAFVVWCSVAWADTFAGLVVKVADGDTITVADANEERRVRLAQIDAPEKKQAFGPDARDKLSGLVLGKAVTVEYKATDRYGRLVGQVKIADTDVNLWLVREGCAWVYLDYPHTPAYVSSESEARLGRRGLWALPSPVAPWVYRRTVRSAAHSAHE
jgi:endonuclease YncB( thermonuclease family)